MFSKCTVALRGLLNAPLLYAKLESELQIDTVADTEKKDYQLAPQGHFDLEHATLMDTLFCSLIHLVT